MGNRSLRAAATAAVDTAKYLPARPLLWQFLPRDGCLAVPRRACYME